MSVLIFASNNNNKIQEIRSILNDDIQIIGLREAGIITDIPEPHPSLEENAKEKSTFIFKLTNSDCFSEDTGLEVFALNGEPGVKSARYAGDENDNQKNIEKLLNKMTSVNDRTAQFRTVISLIMNGKEIQFEGICKGMIIKIQRGDMEITDKNIFSHRKKATSKLIDFLNKNHDKN